MMCEALQSSRKASGKRVNDYLGLPSTRDYIAALEDEESQSHSKEFTFQKIRYVKTSRVRLDRGGGAWLHPDLAVHFARWLDVAFPSGATAKSKPSKAFLPIARR